MSTTSEGHLKIEQYLSGKLSLLALNDWSLEFGDDPDQTSDGESMELAGLITELVHDLGEGSIDEPAIWKQLATRVGHPTPHQRSA